MPAVSQLAAQGVAPDQKDLWAWQQWAASQDPSTYGWKGAGVAIDGSNLGVLKPALVAAGKWNPQWDSILANPRGGGGSIEQGTAQEATFDGLDLSSLNGYELRNARTSGQAGLSALFDPSGQMVNGSGSAYTRGHQSLNGDDYAAMAAVLAAGYGTAALAGTTGGAAAGGASAAGGSAGGAAGAVGSTTAEQIALMQANGLTAAEISAATGGQVAGYTAADVAAMSAASPTITQIAYGTTGANTGGLTAAKVGATGMGAGDWIALAGLAGGLYTSKKAQDSADAYAASSAQMSADMLAFTKQQYADNLPYVKAAQEKSLQVADAQLASQKQSDALAADYAAYNKETFRPLEQKMVADATNYDTPERRQAAANDAMAGVNTSLAAVREAKARTLAASGINPGSTRALAAMDGQDVQQASALSSAAYNARKGVEDTAVARQTNAVSLGRNLPANQVASANAAVQAGNSAVNTSVAGANAGNPGTALVQSGYNGAISGNTAAGNLQARANDASAALWGNLGNSAGRYITSDKNMKTDIEDADPEAALDQVTSTPVSNFKYDPAKMAAEGIPMDRPAGEEQTGAMAQDVNATMGEEAAPNGKKINVGTLIGKTMLAVQALNTKVDNMAQMLNSGRLGVTA